MASLLSITATQFIAAPLWGRALLLLAVRVAKMHYQQQLRALASRLPDASVETAAVSGEAVFIVFHIACFQAEPSIWLVLGLVTVDAVEVGVHMRTISRLSPELTHGSRIRSANELTRSAITSTSTSDRADVDRRADEDDEAPMPSTPMDLVPSCSYAPDIRIDFPREVLTAPPRIRVNRSAKIYCAQYKDTLIIRLHPMPTRNSAPSTIGNCTRDLAPIETSNAPLPRANELSSAAMQRRQSSRSSRQSVIEGRSCSRSTSKPGVSIKKRRGSGESTRLPDLVASCETLLLEKFTALLLLVIYAAAMRMLWSLPNALFNLFLACMTASELLEREVLVFAYISAELALMLYVARFARRLDVQVLFLVGYAFKYFPVVVYAEIIAYCFHALQKLSAHHHALQEDDGCDTHNG